MKLEDLLEKCPKCGSQDKVARRRIIDTHRAHAELDSYKCENCGYIFEKKEKDEDDMKHKVVKELNKKLY